LIAVNNYLDEGCPDLHRFIVSLAIFEDLRLGAADTDKHAMFRADWTHTINDVLSCGVLVPVEGVTPSFRN